MREKLKLIVNIVLVCITIERAFAELKKDHRRKKRLAEGPQPN